MRLAQMLVNKYLLALGALLLGGYIFWTAGLVWQAIMVVIAVAMVAGWRRARGEDAGAVPRGTLVKGCER